MTLNELVAAFSAGLGVASIPVGVLWRALLRAQRQLRAQIQSPRKSIQPEPTSPIVLIVDDNPTDRALFVAAMEPLDVRVAEAASAEQALALMRAQQWAVIVVDCKLPGLSGPDLIRRLRTPAVLLSALDRDELQKQAESCGATWLQKSGDVQAMVTTVARLLR